MFGFPGTQSHSHMQFDHHDVLDRRIRWKKVKAGHISIQKAHRVLARNFFTQRKPEPESKGCHHLGNSRAPVLKESTGSARYYKIITNALDCHRFPFITTICNLSTESLFGTSYKMSILRYFGHF